MMCEIEPDWIRGALFLLIGGLLVMLGVFAGESLATRQRKRDQNV